MKAQGGSKGHPKSSKGFQDVPKSFQVGAQGVAGVLRKPDGTMRYWFFEIDKIDADLSGADIQFFETLAVLASTILWKDELQGEEAICAIDNSSAQGSLVKGHSKDKISYKFIRANRSSPVEKSQPTGE